MIISEEYKYIFIGLPFAGSTAISKELAELYKGRPISWKHANVTDLAYFGIDPKDYFVFAVYRDPVEMAFTHYNKLVTNAHGVFTNPQTFIENGGWISKRARKIYCEVQREGLSFDQYLSRHFSIHFDGVFSLNRPHLDMVLDFTDLAASFRTALQNLGITPIRDLPTYNVTQKPATFIVADQTVKSVFGPFLYTNGLDDTMKPSTPRLILFKAAQLYRFRKWKLLDRKMQNRLESGYDFIEKKL